MAGDWIKMRNDLADDPAVIGMAAKLGMDEFAVVGRLHRFWSWADRHSLDGHASGVTKAWIDRYLQCDGFADAMETCAWLVVTGDGVSVPNFDRHNGESAKKRGLATERKRKQREVTQPSTNMSRNERDESVTREEKRREEVNTGAAAYFDTFWTAYPKKVGKDAAQKAFEKRKPTQALLAEMLEALTSQKASAAWAKNGGEFIPNPATWINQGRWKDGDAESGQVGSIFAGAI